MFGYFVYFKVMCMLIVILDLIYSIIYLFSLKHVYRINMQWIPSKLLINKAV